MSVPTGKDALALLAEEARGCRACPLWEINTQVVFGEGPATARLLFVGEAPGRTEDEQGRPFVGAAGHLFAEGLAHASLARDAVYVTNTVKHRPWVQQGARQKNRPPKASEITACAPWLDRELALLRPALICCLGAVAAKRVLGADFKLTQARGTWHEGPVGAQVLATVHPSFVLIQPADSRQRWRETFFADLALVAERLRAVGTTASPSGG